MTVLDSGTICTTRLLATSLSQTVLKFEFGIAAQQGTSQLESVPEISLNKRGGLGIWKDKIWIVDDFDAPLDDFQEYM